MAIAFALPLAACSAQSTEPGAPDGNEPVPLTLQGGPTSFSYGIPQLIESLETDIAHGIDFEYNQAAANSATTIAALMSGDIDVAGSGAISAFEAIAGGQDLRVLACANSLPMYLVLRPGLMSELGVTVDSPLKEKIKALEGLSIATTPPGNSVNASLEVMMQYAGMSTEEDLNVVGLGDNGAIVAGLKQQQFDGAYWNEAVIEGAVATGDAELLISLKAGHGDDALGDSLDSNGLFVASGKWVDENPELAEAVYFAARDAARAIHDDFEATGVKMKEDWFPDMPKDLYDELWADSDSVFGEDAACDQGKFESNLKFSDGISKRDLVSRIDYDKIVLEVAKR